MMKVRNDPRFLNSFLLHSMRQTEPAGKIQPGWVGRRQFRRRYTVGCVRWTRETVARPPQAAT